MLHAGFDKLSLSGSGIMVKKQGPLILSSSKGHAQPWPSQ